MKRRSPANLMVAMTLVAATATACTASPTTSTPFPPADTPVPPTATLVRSTDTPVPATDTPVVPTHTPAPLAATSSIVLATSPEQIAGVWLGRGAHAMYQQFNADGTCLGAERRHKLDDSPNLRCIYKFEGTQMVHTTLEVSGIPPCSDDTSVYEVRILPNGWIEFVKVRDTCSPRAGTMTQVHEPVP